MTEKQYCSCAEPKWRKEDDESRLWCYTCGLYRNVPEPTAQTRFNDTYITASEICSRLHVAKSSIVHARRRGMLPDPVIVADGQFFLWERSTVNRYLDAWELTLTARRHKSRVQA